MRARTQRPVSNLFAAAFFGLLAWCGALHAANDGLAPEITDLNAKDVSMQWEKRIPYLETPYLSAAPKDMKDGIPVGALGLDGGDREMILKFVRERRSYRNCGRRAEITSCTLCYVASIAFALFRQPFARP